MNQFKLKQALEHFFIEDIGDIDVTSDYLFEDRHKGEVVFEAKQSGVLCGTAVILTGFQMLDPSINVQLLKKDGDAISQGETIAIANGEWASLLKGERVILNLVQRMSGIATLSRRAVANLNSGHTRICDTRKTTPGLRMFEKCAVRAGGGFNHRNGLYDAVMIKDNHITFAGSIKQAVGRVRKRIGHMVNVEVETETEEQVLEAVEAGADCIMFDNRSVEEIQRFVQLVPPHITTEASGGIAIKDLLNYSDCGVDYISLGCLTHSAPSLDISVNVDMKERRSQG
ncbi:carboxylating nicotinate-nucleotide diphosphorylase [Halobacillus shinanisalinarum]|uniref:nicotinate-nucleotide diphosphorylase (carboxylating) n=1 Tax=Halobacillus shinanisalinarum TaxID=2932258 RepID=A0ABY4H2Y8_9BACI|nr:carboxylating nicotinate-nucleotide diphosphorylase [Halobacillus shinanisalinarum]UOQ94500.1 carboxylating nicotinate-nucleotide diphosphorylase [Halobacillus shinanisalinarum]